MEVIAKLYPILDNHDCYNILIGEDETEYDHSILFGCDNKSIELYYNGLDDPPYINIPISIRKHIVCIFVDDYTLMHFMVKSMYIYCLKKKKCFHKIYYFRKLQPYDDRSKSILINKTEKLIVFFVYISAMDILKYLMPIVKNNGNYNIQIGKDTRESTHSILFRHNGIFIDLYNTEDDVFCAKIPAQIRPYIVYINYNYSMMLTYRATLPLMAKYMYIYYRHHEYSIKLLDLEKLDPYGYTAYSECGVDEYIKN